MSAGVGETGKLGEIGMELGALIDRHAGVLLLLRVCRLKQSQTERADGPVS